MAIKPLGESLIPAEESPVFTVDADLVSSGRFGGARLVVTGEGVYRFEQTPLGEELIASYALPGVSNPRIEDLVDASSLVADIDGQTVELLRCSGRRALSLAVGQRRLAALLAGEPIVDADVSERNCPKCGRPLPKESELCESCVNRGKTLIRLFSYAAPHRLRLFWGAVLTIGGTAFELLPPYLTLRLVDDVLRQRKTELFLPLLGTLILSRLAIMGIQIARGRNVSYLGMRMAVAIRESLFTKLQELSLSFYDKRNVGSIMSRMTNDTSAVYDVLIDGVPVVLNQAMLLIGIPVAMLLINPPIAIWVLAPVPLVLIAVKLFRRKMHRIWSRVWHAWSRLGGALAGVLQGTRVVKAFRGEEREVDRFGRRIRDLAGIGYQAETHWSTFFPIVMFTVGTSAFFVWWVGGQAVLQDRMTLGELTAFIGYLAMMQQPMMMLQRIVDWTTRSLTAAERVFEVIDTPVDIQQAAGAEKIPNLQGEIEFRDVHFGYDKARDVVKGVDLRIAPGEMIGLVGASGSGKTTLVSLLLRFYDPTQGVIEVDGHDLKKVDLDDYRRQVGVVLQESYLFPGSIADNIAYGRPDCTVEEIISAAMAANAHTFITGFADGYDTHVGERGQRLSGGERQRIAIARAILHNPKVLVLDEATSSVDTETERMIQEALENLVSGRTVVAIAHRLSTLRAADRIVVLGDGRIVEVGTHDELLRDENGVYTKLVNMQLDMNKAKQNVIGGEPSEDDDEHDPEKPDDEQAAVA